MTGDLDKTYIGDSVYASHNGWQIKLEADGNVIYLEPEVLQALDNYRNMLREKHQAKKEG